MAAGDTAKLIAQLIFDTSKFSPGVKQAIADVGNLDTSLGRIGATAKRGAATAGTNLARIGTVALAGIGAAVKTGLDDLAELESATTAADGAIQQMGLTGQVTGQQIAEWANQIEADIGAAFDDKEIVAASATLIRFGKVTSANLRPSLEVIADLATKTGSVESAATLLAKALADPTKAAGKLSRAGVVLTKTQKDQIKAFTEAGEVGEAQRVILDAIAESTKGAAAASQGPYQQALSVLADTAEDARKALAEGFLPVLEKVAGLLSRELAKPETLQNIREFGQGLAAGLDSLISIAQRLPWDSIGNSLTIAGTGARAVLDAFVGLPPWVQTAVLTGWGLNKLTGGALSGIVGELSKGLIKGILGINAGVVNITAGTVTGGGVPGATPGTPAAGGAGGAVNTVLKTATVAAGVGIATTIQDELSTWLQRELQIPKPVADIPRELFFPGIDELGKIPEIIGGALDDQKGVVVGRFDRLNADMTAANRAQSERLEALAASYKTEQAGVTKTIETSAANTVAEFGTVGSQIVSAIQIGASGTAGQLAAMAGSIGAAVKANEATTAAKLAITGATIATTSASVAAAVKAGASDTSARLNTANSRLGTIAAKKTTFVANTFLTSTISIRAVGQQLHLVSRYDRRSIAEAG